MNRNDAIDHARGCALAHARDHAYLPTSDAEAADWLPHAWVVDAIVSAAAPLAREAWTWSKACENACQSDRAAREHLRLAIDHIAALNGALEDLASLGATIAICGTKYDDAAAREVLRPNVPLTGARTGGGN